MGQFCRTNETIKRCCSSNTTNKNELDQNSSMERGSEHKDPARGKDLLLAIDRFWSRNISFLRGQPSLFNYAPVEGHTTKSTGQHELFWMGFFLKEDTTDKASLAADGSRCRNPFSDIIERESLNWRLPLRT